MKAKYAKGFRIPGWQFLIAMSLYVELLLYFWTAGTILPGRLAAIVLFALAFGCGLGLITSLLPEKAEKWTTVVLSVLLGTLCLVEYFLNDAFQYFMPLISIFTTAGDVAGGYSGTILSLVSKNLWRIALVLLPVVIFAVLNKGTRRSWKRSLALTLAAAVLYASGIGTVNLIGTDRNQLSGAATFDGTVRSFGLSMGVLIDLTGGAAVGSGGVSFELPQETLPPETTAPAETQATEPGATDGTEPAETTEPTEPPRVFQAHAFDLDFAALAEAETNSNIANLHRYVASLTPDMENEYTGLFAGKNLIFITAEAFTAEVIDPELTPALYRMATEGIHFTDGYQQLWGCGTTGGEFANLTSIIPFGGTSTMMEAVDQNLFMTMGNQLQKQGYASGAFHNGDYDYYNRNLTHMDLGYDSFMGWGNGMEELINPGWTRSDKEMIETTLSEYLNNGPFSLYYMTVSGHSPYTLDNDMAEKNYELVKDLNKSMAIKCYLASNLELEFAMQSLIAMLEEAGIADDTVVVISGDHYPYGLAPSDTWDKKDYVGELFGADWGDDAVRDHNALIIWSGCLEDMDIVVDDPVSSLDLLPTLSNLFGLEYDSRLMAGRDVFSDSEPLVFWPLSYSWKTDKGYYKASYARFYPNEGVEVDEGYVERINAIVRNKVVYCRGVQYNDYFNVISDLMGFEK